MFVLVFKLQDISEVHVTLQFFDLRKPLRPNDKVLSGIGPGIQLWKNNKSTDTPSTPLVDMPSPTFVKIGQINFLCGVWVPG